MREMTRGDLVLAALCVGVMGAGAALVGAVPFRRAAAAVQHARLSPDLSRCATPRRGQGWGPDVYIVPSMGFDHARSLEVANYLEDTLALDVKLSPPLSGCAGCVSGGEVDLDRMYAGVDAHIPELTRHPETIRLALTELDLDPGAARGGAFGGRSVRVPVAVVSTSRLGEGEDAQARLHKLAARYVARMAMRCASSGDPRSFVHDQPPRTLDDVDVMQVPVDW